MAKAWGLPGWARGPMHRAACGLALLCGLVACDDVSRFSTEPGEYYCGNVVQGPIVRAGLGPATQLRLSLNADALQTDPGRLTTSDGLFSDTPLRPIPQLAHDSLSTFNFGEGRQRNMIFVATPSDQTRGGSIYVFLSLLDNGDAEVRLMRGAPNREQPALDADPMTAPIFGIFPLQRQKNECFSLASPESNP